MPDKIEEKPATEEEKVEKPEAEAEKPKPEKMLPQSEVNKLMADERRKHKAELDRVTTEAAEFKKTVEDREAAANEAATKKVEALRKDLPEPIIALLDKLTPIDQLEWLSDPANLITKKTIPDLPDERGDARKGPVIKTII